MGNPPGGSDGKESACNAGDLGSIPWSERSPGGGLGSPLQYSCLENPHGQRSLAGYSPWGHKELDMTEWLSIAHTYIIYSFSYSYFTLSHTIINIKQVPFAKDIDLVSN